MQLTLLTKKAKTLRFEQIRVFFRFCVAKSNPRGNSFDGRMCLWYSKKRKCPSSFGRLHVWFKAALFWRRAAYFLLFIFTFKVGKSYENSVNHGGNTSHQTDDKIDCHTYAFLVNYFQEKLLESFACKTR